MAGELDKVLQEALQLSEQERAELAGRVIDSLDSAFDEDVEQAWDAEIARRAADLDEGMGQTVPWPELRQRLLRRLDDASAA